MTLQKELQAFKAENTSEVLYINSRQDKLLGHRVVLFSDIQQVFDNIKYILDGDEVIQFLAGDDFNDLTPKRITFRPGTILQIIPASTAQQFHNAMTGSQKSQQLAITAGNTKPSINEPESTMALIKISELTISDEGKSSIHAYNRLYESYFQAVINGQALQAVSIKNDMDRHFERLQTEMDKNSALQKQVLNMQSQLKEKQDQMQILQQQALDRLATIQEGIKAVITQTFELHEFPIPRLFIVLPKQDRLSDMTGKLFVHQFRLYFLCECEKHTLSNGDANQHKIHLAKHEGYDIQRPSEFFDKYGRYLLTMMQMFKYGIAVAGAVSPALAQLKAIEGTDSVQGFNQGLGEDITLIVDNTITFLESKQNGAYHNIKTNTTNKDLGNVEILEGADLRRVESFLIIKDEGRNLGNLYRTVTSEGHVKWVCVDHYRQNYQESMTKQLIDVVNLNGGTFDESIGKVTIKVKSNTEAKQLYDSMYKARGVHELEISLAWDVTMNDLRKLSSAVTDSNIVSLTIDGCECAGTALDLINRQRRFDPIIQLMSNKRIQSLNIRGFKDFYRRVTPSAISVAPQLRLLSIHLLSDNSTLTPATISQEIISKVMENSQSLTELNILTNDPSLIIDLAAAKFNKTNISRIDLESNFDHKRVIATFQRPQNQVAKNGTLSGKLCDLKITMDIGDSSILNKFYGTHGQYISTIGSGLLNNSNQCKELEKSIACHKSSLTSVIFNVEFDNETWSYITAMSEIIINSPVLENIGIVFSGFAEPLTDLDTFLKDHGKRISFLKFSGFNTISEISRVFPTRGYFSQLETLCIELQLERWSSDGISSAPGPNTQSSDAKWLANFIKGRSLLDNLYYGPQDASSTTRNAVGEQKRWKPIKKLAIHICEDGENITGIENIIKAMDFNTMNELDFNINNSCLSYSKKIVEIIVEKSKDIPQLPLKKLSLGHITRTNAEEKPCMDLLHMLSVALPNTEIVTNNLERV
ncbi:hypothetical protein BGZ76_000631 [Entomortierella beljakovae]|nr:hypothetical protein BGZ76_000631 [Entomortierella beljakovae]